MVRSSGVRTQAGAEPSPDGGQPSLGDLVALAAKDVSQLIRYEMDLAKSELRADIKRGATAGLLGGFAAFVGCLILVLLSFALTYGLYLARPLWGTSNLYACFLWAALFLAVLAALLAGVAMLVLRRFSKMQKTRKTVTADIDMLRARANGAGDGALPDASRTALARDGAPAATDDRSLPR